MMMVQEKRRQTVCLSIYDVCFSAGVLGRWMDVSFSGHGWKCSFSLLGWDAGLFVFSGVV